MATNCFSKCLLKRALVFSTPSSQPQILNAYGNSLVISKRTFLPNKITRIQEYKERVELQRERFGPVIEEFKTQFMERLDDSETTLLTEDYTAYVDLADENDTENFPQILERYLSQQDSVIGDLGLKDRMFHLSPVMLRQCHLLKSLEPAKQVYEIASKREQTISGKQLILDMLYRNNDWESCVNYGIACLEKKEQWGTHWLYKIIALAAYNMESAEGLKSCARVYDLARKDKRLEADPLTLEQLQRLIVLYCIEQAQINAAFTLMKSLDVFDTASTNLKMLAYLKAGRPNSAYGILMGTLNRKRGEISQQEENKELSAADKTSSKPTRFLFTDVLRLFYEMNPDERQRKALGYIYSQRDSSLFNQSLRSFILFPLKPFKKMMREDAAAARDTAAAADTDSVETVDEEYEKEMSSGYYADDTTEKSAADSSSSDSESSAPSSDSESSAPSSDSDSGDSSSDSDTEQPSDKQTQTSSDATSESAAKEGTAV